MEEKDKEKKITEILEAVEAALNPRYENLEFLIDYNRARKAIGAILDDLENSQWDDEEEMF
jgi:hypothetical protein